MEPIEAVDGYVQFDVEGGGGEPDLIPPHKARRVALDLLNAASEAQAHRATEEKTGMGERALVALARLARDSPHFNVGVEDAEHDHHVEHRRLWICGIETVGAWDVRAEALPEWLDERECPGRPDDDALDVIAGMAEDGDLMGAVTA